MAINIHHQLTLLVDILDDHYHGCSLSVSEYEQIKRTVQWLANHPSVSNNFSFILDDLYNYGHQGTNVASIEEHANTHKHDISAWKNSIEELMSQ
ncbi:MAG TPA: YtzH-like family protein [Bacillota bacterium]|nr:YtzH-like family protein [Bacillota bacterium]